MISFLGLLTMQVGVLVLSTSFITNSICTILTNVLSLNSETTLAWIIVLIFCIFIIITWCIAFEAAFNESFKLLRIAQIMWSILICIWIVLIMCSIFPSLFNNVCIEARCPESMWLVNNARPFISCENDNNCDQNNSTDTINSTTISSIRKYYFTNDTQLSDKFQYDQINLSRTNMQSRSTQATIITSIILLIIYLVVFTYSWAFLQSYKSCIRNKNTSANPNQSAQDTR